MAKLETVALTGFFLVLIHTSLYLVIFRDVGVEPKNSQLDGGEASEYFKYPTTKADLWKDLKEKQQEVINQHQYCMLWCPGREFGSVPEAKFYRDVSVQDAKRLGSYYTTENRDIYQASSRKVLNVTCCQIATRESFIVVHDSRNLNDLDNDVTIVTFGNFERIEALYEIRNRWHGPLVFILYLQDHNDALYSSLKDGKHLTSAQELETLKAELQPKWDNTAIFAFYSKYEVEKKFIRVGFNANYYQFSTSRFATTVKKLFSPEEAARKDLVLQVDFPINTLRNVAQDFALTRFVFAVDIDFLPDSGAYEFFKAHAKDIAEVPKTAIAIPHFEKRPQCNWIDKAYEYPTDFKALDEQLKAGLVRPFYAELNFWGKNNSEFFHWSQEDMKSTNCTIEWDREHSPQYPVFPQGIYLTDYKRWFTHSRDEKLQDLYQIPRDLMKTEQLTNYEPYLLLDRVANSTHYLMRYNEVFVNRFRDKSSWVTGLRLTGYNFLVGRQHYLFHKDHPLNPLVEPTKGPRDILKKRMFMAGDTYIQHLQSLNES
jgi:hypothetical protein